MRPDDSHRGPLVQANQSQSPHRMSAGRRASLRTSGQRRELWREKRAAVIAGKLSDEPALRQQQSSLSPQSQQPLGQHQQKEGISVSSPSSDRNDWPRVGQASEVAPPASNETPPPPPLIHTDHFNTTTRLLYVADPSDKRQGQRQLTRLNTLAASFARGRAGRLMATQHPDNMATSASSNDQLIASLNSPRLDIVNLEVTPTSATLTWSLSWLAPGDAIARSKRDTINVRASLADNRSKKRHETGQDDERDEEPRSEPGLEDEAMEDLDRARRRDESQRLNATTKTSTTTSTTITSTAKPTDEFALEIDELPRTKKGKNEDDHADDILRRKQQTTAPIQNGTVRPLAQSGGPARRPPNRQHHQQKQEGRMQQHQNMTTTPTLADTTTDKIRSEMSVKKQPSESNRSATSPKATTTSQTKPTAQTHKSSTEPPMVRLPAVAINRISSTTKPTGGLTNDTSSPVTNAKSRDRTRAKNLRLHEPTPTGTTTGKAPEEVNNSTAPTSTVLPTASSPASPPTVDKDASESSMKSTVASTSAESHAPPIPTLQSTTTTVQPPPATIQPGPVLAPTQPSTSQRPVISVTKSQLITADQPAPVRAAKQADPASAPLKSNWMVRLRKFGSSEVDIVKISANLADFTQGQPITRSIAFKMLDPSSGYEICVESASPDQLLGDKHQILNANHFLKCHDVSDLELTGHTTGNSTRDGRVRRMDLAQIGPPDGTGGEPDLGDKSTAARMKSLCREFFTPAANSNQTINFSQLQTSVGSDETGALGLPDASGIPAESSRRPKALGGGSGALANNPLKSRVELMEIVSEQREPAVFEMFSSSSNSRGGRSAMSLSESAANATGTNTLLTRPLMALDTSSLLPIVACVFLLIFLATLANMVLNLLHCADRPGGRAGAAAGGLRGSARRLRQRLRRRSGRNRLAAAQLTTGHLRPLSPLNSPSRAGYFGSSERSGSSSLGGTSKSRMLVVGEQLGEPYASSSSYFDIPNSDHQAHLYGRLSPAANGLLRLHSESTTPTYGVVGRAGTPAAASVYALSSAARFPLGPSFEGDEKHNADMVGLARRNYDNFISNIYNADNLASELSNAQLNSGRNGTANTNERDTKRELLIQATTFKQQEEVSGAARRSLTVPAKQRIRFDKVNPIYNMDGIQQFSSRPQAAPSFAGQGSPASSTCSSSVGAQTATTSVDSSAAVAAAKSPRRPPEPGSLSDSPANEQFQIVSTNSALDKQKQRFHAQQQQLERVLSKSGSLVPQPFIAPVGDHRTSGEPAEANSLKSSFLFGERLPNEAQTSDGRKGEDVDFNLVLPSPPPPPPPPPLKEEANPASSPESAGAAQSLPSAKKPLVQLHQTGTFGQAQARTETIDETDFRQRRKELASKLHLAGVMEQQQPRSNDQG